MSARARLETRLRPRTRSIVWSPTAVLAQAAILGVVGALLAVVTRRLDLLVLASPGLGLLWWAAFTHPRTTPRIAVELSSTAATEGVPVEWVVSAQVPPDDHVADLGLCLATAEDLRIGKPGPALVIPFGRTAAQDQAHEAHDAHEAHAAITLTSTRWGRRRMGAATYAFTSSWGLFRHGAGTVEPALVDVLPRQAVTTGHLPVSHPVGLVGGNRSRSRGEGSEFDDIRPFRPGDRLRQIHWPVSARTGELHARTTYADQDAEVWLLLDTAMDVDGYPASSLDLQVRSAAGLAWRLLSQGERVGVATFLSDRPLQLAPAAGATQYRRILGMLARVSPATRSVSPRDALRHVRASPGAWMVILTPLLAPTAADRAAHLAARGHPVIVIDALPAQPQVYLDAQEQMELAWRLRMLERTVEIDRLRRRGVPVAHADDDAGLGSALVALSRRPRMAMIRR